MGTVSTKLAEIPPEVNFENVGLGTMRASGTYIALMLQMESPGQRAGILAHVAKTMGISLQEFTDEYIDEMCGHCGCSMMHHEENGGCF